MMVFQVVELLGCFSLLILIAEEDREAAVIEQFLPSFSSKEEVALASGADLRWKLEAVGS